MDEKTDEMVEHWLICVDCGNESPRKMVPREFVDKLEAAGQAMCPSLGRCWPCRQGEIVDQRLLEEVGGNA